ncbi:MAG: FHA domain-containing protein, partial [Pirellulaceae bacterium]
AKILKSGDRIQVGQLEFELVMEMELGGARKPEVRSVEDVIERTVEQSNENRSVEIDISSWLEEADQVDRGAVPSSFETRQLVLEDTGSIGKKDAEESGSGDEETKGAKPLASGKLPKVNKGPTSKNSRDAAQETLKKYFGGRG